MNEAQSDFKLRILHVDDNADDHALFHLAIGRVCPGCEVEEAESPDDVFRSLGSRPPPDLPHVIITDGSFHGTDGAAFIGRLREHFPKIPVIALSGRDDQATINRAYEAGASAYLVKPADLPTLVERLRALTTFWEHSKLPQ